ncbi:MAG: hypothetical protein M3R24_09740 [Chloroflexota bacterium]|nr:hypothetical protein [Chloroflexota bacterium]
MSTEQQTHGARLVAALEEFIESDPERDRLHQISLIRDLLNAYEQRWKAEGDITEFKTYD